MPADKKSSKENKELVIESFIALEEKRISVDKLREENVAKELEASSQSSKDAQKVALKEIEVQEGFIEKSFSFRKMIAVMIFSFCLIFLVGSFYVVAFLSKNNPLTLDKLFAFYKDGLKILGGFIVGFASDVIRQKTKKDQKK